MQLSLVQEENIKELKKIKGLLAYKIRFKFGFVGFVAYFGGKFRVLNLGKGVIANA